mgnify:CR=1 FL=1
MRQEVCRARIKKKGSGVLNSLEKNCYNGRFSHIYVEEAVWNHPRTQKILSRFPQAQVIPVHHYKDVFCRRGQSVVRQHKTQNLILAEKISFIRARWSAKALVITGFIIRPA